MSTNQPQLNANPTSELMSEVNAAPPMDPEIQCQIATMMPFADGFWPGILKLWEQHNRAPVFVVDFGAGKLAILGSAEAIHEAYVKQGAKFAYRPPMETNRIFSGGSFQLGFGMTNGETSRKYRKFAVQYLFNAAKLPAYVPAILQNVNAFITKAQAASGPVDVRPMLHFMQNSTLLRLITGLSFPEDDPRIPPIIQSTEEIMTMFFQPAIGDVIPALIPATPELYARVQAANDAQKQRLANLLAESRVLYAKGQLKSCMVSAMLDQQAEDEDPLSDEAIIQLMFEMSTAGEHTTVSLVEFILVHLANDEPPGYQQKLYDEAIAILGSDGHCTVDKHLPAHTAYILETMRAPYSAGVPHMCNEDAEVLGVKIHAGTVVFGPPGMGFMDPTIWDAPGDFNPDRFLPPSRPSEKPVAADGTDPKFTPFGSGRRVCPGYRLALLSTTIFLSEIIRRFTIGRPTAEKLSIEANHVNMTPKVPAVVCFTPRK